MRTTGCLPGKECCSPPPHLSPVAFLSLSLLSPTPYPVTPTSFLLPSPCSPHAWASPGCLATHGCSGCAPDPRNHAGHLRAAEPHPGAAGPRGGPAAHLPLGQLLHDRGGCGPAHVPPPAGQVPTEGLPPPHLRGLEQPPSWAGSLSSHPEQALALKAGPFSI